MAATARVPITALARGLPSVTAIHTSATDTTAPEPRHGQPSTSAATPITPTAPATTSASSVSGTHT